jgi:hypothetical protein
MFHPFETDLTALTDHEVEEKLHEITKKYFIAARLGNPQLLTQLSTFVMLYKDEMSRRYMARTKGQLDNDLDQLINVD